MRKIGLLLALGLLLPGAASAAEYVCTLRHYPAGSSGTAGNYGAVAIVLNDGPHCSGVPTTTKYVCTTGATSTACPQYVSRSETGLLLMTNLLQKQMETGAEIQGQVAYCNGGGTSCWSDIILNSPPAPKAGN